MSGLVLFAVGWKMGLLTCVIATFIRNARTCLDFLASHVIYMYCHTIVHHET